MFAWNALQPARQSLLNPVNHSMVQVMFAVLQHRIIVFQKVKAAAGLQPKAASVQLAVIQLMIIRHIIAAVVMKAAILSVAILVK